MASWLGRERQTSELSAWIAVTIESLVRWGLGEVVEPAAEVRVVPSNPTRGGVPGRSVFGCALLETAPNWAALTAVDAAAGSDGVAVLRCSTGSPNMFVIKEEAESARPSGGRPRMLSRGVPASVAEAAAAISALEGENILAVLSAVRAARCSAEAARIPGTRLTSEGLGVLMRVMPNSWRWACRLA